MEDFVHLHVHTQYSILDGQASIQRLVDKAIKDGMRGMAVTDHGNMMGIKEFFNYVGKKNGGTNGEIKAWKKRIALLEKGLHAVPNPPDLFAIFVWFFIRQHHCGVIAIIESLDWFELNWFGYASDIIRVFCCCASWQDAKSVDVPDSCVVSLHN